MTSSGPRSALQLLFGLLLTLGGCASQPVPNDPNMDPGKSEDLSEGPDSSPDSSMMSMADQNSSGDAGPTDMRTSTDGIAGLMHRCNADPPMGAALPDALPRYTNGTCPMFMPGKNTLKSTNMTRTFLLVVPTGLSPMEKLPVVFLWHWLGGSADSFLRKGEIQKAVDTQRFLAIIPEAAPDQIFKWPFDTLVLPARMEQEFKFFDDMLACAAAQFNVNRNCVASAGVSAGALFTDQLASHRGQYLSSAISLSGGVGSFAKPWGNGAHKLPFIVLWGGPNDKCVGIIDFNKASKDLQAALTTNGHFQIECVHNCAHSEPPFEGPMGFSKYAGLWQFVFDHPFWLRPGESPYKMTGLPTGMPPWCAIGVGKATPRTGSCPDKPGC